MSLAESFFSAGKQFLLATENLKRLDEKVSRLADDVSTINLRLVRLETIVTIEGPPKRRPKARTLPGEVG